MSGGIPSTKVGRNVTTSGEYMKRTQDICVMHRLPFFNYRVVNSSSGTVDLYIDGIIVDASTEQFLRDWWNDDTATSFKKIRDQIEEAKPSVINCYLNTPGGQVTEAMAIHDYFVSLQQKGIQLNTFGRGIIASAGTYILMADPESTISENSFFMIHEVAGMTYGSVSECENQVRILRQFNDKVAKFYAKRTGKSVDEINQLMHNETWYDGQEAVDNGFVKNLEPSISFDNEIDPSLWLFNNTQVLEAYNSFTIKNFQMKFDPQKFANDLKTALEKQFNFKFPTNNPGAENQFQEAVTNALKPLQDSIGETVQNAVAEAMKGDTIQNMVNEAMKGFVKNEDLKGFAKNEDLEGLAKSEDLKDFAKSSDLEEVKNNLDELEKDLTKGAGEARTNRRKSGKEPKNEFDIEGIGFTNSAQK